MGTELQDALERYDHKFDYSIAPIVEAARRVANLDMEAATSVLEGAYDIPPVTAKIMAQYTVFAALSITTEDDDE